jgi:hypothetical protein
MPMLRRAGGNLRGGKVEIFQVLKYHNKDETYPLKQPGEALARSESSIGNFSSMSKYSG